MNALRILLAKELKEHWRTYRLPIIAGVAMVFGMLSPLLAKYLPEIIKNSAGPIQITMPEPTATDAVDQMVSNLGQNISLFGAILLAMGLVARERERGTAAFILTKPVPRWAFLAAKFLGLAAILAVALLLGGALSYGYTIWIFGTALPVGGFLASIAILWLMALIYGGFTLFASTLTRSSLAAAGMGIGLTILVSMLGVIPALKDWLPGALNGLARSLALGETPADPAQALLGNGLVLAIALGGALLILRRQEV